MLIEAGTFLRQYLGSTLADIQAKPIKNPQPIETRGLLAKLAQAPSLPKPAREALKLQALMTPTGPEYSLTQPEVLSASGGGLERVYLVEVSNAGTTENVGYYCEDPEKPEQATIGTRDLTIRAGEVPGLDTEAFYRAVLAKAPAMTFSPSV